MKRFLMLIGALAGLLMLDTCQPAPKQAEFVVKVSLEAVLRHGFDGAVLSWNIMEAPDSHIACLGK